MVLPAQIVVSELAVTLISAPGVTKTESKLMQLFVSITVKKNSTESMPLAIGLGIKLLSKN
jgi:hypothetical protein